MNDVQIQCFLEAAKYLNFTSAASAVYITQPTLSKNISSLEQELGVQLFYRNYRSIQLTNAGKLLYEGLTGMAAGFKELLENAKLANANYIGKLNIGLLSGQIISPQIEAAIHSFEACYPTIQVNICSKSFGALLDGLRSRELDFAVTTTFSVQMERDFKYTEYIKLKNYMMIHRQNPLACKDVTFLSVSQEDSNVVTRNYQHTCRQAGFEPHMLEAPDLETMVLWLELNRGITVVNEEHSASMLPQLVRREIPEFEPTSSAIVWYPGNENPAQSMFMDIISNR